MGKINKYPKADGQKIIFPCKLWEPPAAYGRRGLVPLNRTSGNQ
jgi:hypothetical protein